MWFKLLLTVFIGGFFRFYKLDWGEGYFFHPDERNIASLAASIISSFNFSFFTKGTFAYGSLIPYLAFGADFFRRTFLSSIFSQDSFTFILFFLRIISALFSTLTILLVFLIGKKFWDKKIGFLAAGIVAFSPGLIQSAHFGTFEAILSFLYLLVFFFSLRLFQKGRLRDFFLAILFIAIASAIKINSLVFTPVSIFILFFKRRKRSKIGINILVVFIGLLFLSLLIVSLSPYYLTENFKGMLNYEQQLVRGKLDTFYIRQFFETKPIIFQFQKILPFLVNPFIVFLLPLFIVCYLFHLIKNLFKKNGNELILLCFLGAIFFPNAFLFTKWSRYMIPAIPFLILFVVVFIEKFIKRWQRPISVGLILTSMLWGLSFMSIYFHRDSRLDASEWIYQNLENNSYLLSETANVVDIPLLRKGKTSQKSFLVKNFDFYNLDYNKALFDEFFLNLEKSDYILIPSRRLFGGMGQFPQKYPLINRYYDLLFSGELGFEKIKDFNSFPKLAVGSWQLAVDDELAEETWSVFDHPVIRIYKKIHPFSKETYERLFEI